MEVNKQLDEWVKGNPVHNKERDECCPDFSCCRGDIVEEDLRKRFAKAYYAGDKKTTNAILGMFLGRAFAGKNIHIAGEDQASH